MKIFSKIMLMSMMLTSFFLPSNKSSPNIIDNNRIQEKVKFENVHIKKFKDSSLDKYISKYNFYKMSFDRNIILADTFDENNYIPNIYEFKLIINPSEYLGFEEYEDLKNEKYVVEIIKIVNNNLYKEFHTLNNNLAKQIIDKAVFINEEHSKYTNLITSLNAEGDFKSKLKINNNSLLSTASYTNNIEDTDNQGILDHFLEVKDLTNDTIQTNLEAENVGPIKTERVSDDPITDLIDENKFKTIGIKKNGGSEWGYLLNTYKYYDYTDDLKTDLIIYDIKTYKLDDFSSHHIMNVIPVYTYSYFYSKEDDSIIKLSPNNYCLGDPEYNFGIKYVSLDGNLNNVEHKNPDEPGYNIEEDNGMCISNGDATYEGVRQNYHNLDRYYTNFLIDGGHLLLDIASSKLDLLSQLAVSKAYELLTNAIYKKEVDLEGDSYSTKKGENMFYHRDIDIVNRNLQSAKNPGTFLKSINFKLDSNKLLFKNKSHQMFYTIALLNDLYYHPNYTGLALNILSMNVYNDNTSLLKDTIDYIGSVENKWAYYIGYDIKPRDIIADSDSTKLYVAYGYKEKQKIKFTPKESGFYKFILKNFSAGAELELIKDGNSYIDFAGIEKIDERYSYITENGDINFKSIGTSYLPHHSKKYLMITTYLNSGKEYEIYVKYNQKNPLNNEFVNYNRLRISSTGILNIYKEDSYLSTISNVNNLKRSSKVINSSEYNVLNGFKPTYSGEYTFDVNDSYYDEEDQSFYKRTATTIILDENYNELFYSSVFQNEISYGLRAYLLKDKQYYIATKATTSSNTYTVSVIKEKYLPHFDFYNPKNIYVNFYKNKINFMLVPSNDITVSFQLKMYNKPNLNGTSLTIYDTKMNVIGKNSNIYNNVLSVTLCSKHPYILELNCPNPYDSLYGNLICRG